MKATAQFELSDQYYRDYYDAWTSSKSRWRRFDLATGVVLNTAGIILLLLLQGGTRAIGIAFIAIGLWELVGSIWQRWMWFNRIRSLGNSNSRIQIDFLDQGLDFVGPNSRGHASWSAFDRAVEVPTGILLWPQRGVLIYIPSNALIPAEAKAEILSRINKQRIN